MGIKVIFYFPRELFQGFNELMLVKDLTVPVAHSRLSPAILCQVPRGILTVGFEIS